MVFFYNSLIFQLLLNGYYSFRIRRSSVVPKWLKIILYSIISFEILVYLTGLIFRQQLPIPVYALIQKINVFWVITNLYFLLLLCLFDLIHFLNKKWIFRVRFNRLALFAFEVIVTLICVLIIQQKIKMSRDNFVEPEVKEFSFQFTLPPDTISADTTYTYKLLVVSDLHLGYLINKPVLEKYIAVINSQQPDIVVIDGDLIDYYLDPLIEEQMNLDLRNLQAPLGIYLVPGNHEYKRDAEANFDWVRNAGITVLKDSIVNISDKLFLIGWDDKSNEENRTALGKLVEEVPNKESCILFAHQPKDIKQAIEHNIPLTISGHTHNGQIFPGNFLSLLYENYYGLHNTGDSYSYTTSGLGLTGFPVKIVSQSEIAIFNIEVK